MKQFIFLFILASNLAKAQPGGIYKPLHFKVFVKNNNVLKGAKGNYNLIWQNQQYAKNQWNEATIKNDGFETAAFDITNYETKIKIFKTGNSDTMYLTCHNSIDNIEFIPGQFSIDRNTNYLLNMQTFNGVKILNQQWENYSIYNNNAIPLLKKDRYCYYPKNMELFDEDEPDVNYVSHSRSQHLKYEPDNLEDYIEILTLYRLPEFSESIFAIGMLDNDEKNSKYDYFFMESMDKAKTWKIKFGLKHNVQQLIAIKNNTFIFADYTFSKDRLVTYNNFGQAIDSIITDNEPCNEAMNMFYPCNYELKTSNKYNIELSSPIMSSHSIAHKYNTVFTNSGIDYIKIDQLPFSPNTISASNDKGETWYPILKLNSKETYVYITMRKNKLVVVSYNYTLVSLDFGKTFTFYKNGTFNGGEWNFIWYDDDTLLNVTKYYTDVMRIVN